MTSAQRRPVFEYVVFATVAAVVAAAVAVIGRFGLSERWGVEASLAWSWGCGVSLVASLLSGLLVGVSGRLALPGVTVALGSMLLRLGALAVLAVGVAVVLQLETRPFLLALALSYLALLMVDTAYALRVAG